MDSRTKYARNILLILLAFLGLGAFFGGLAFIISPTGELIGMPLSMLARSGFQTFLIPGILLFVFLGVSPLLLIYALVKNPPSRLAETLNPFKDMSWPWSYSIYQAIALIIWIQLEMVLLQAVHWLHTFYMFYAVAILILALLPQNRNLYRRQRSQIL